jgi:hexosaminidase
MKFKAKVLFIFIFLHFTLCISAQEADTVFQYRGVHLDVSRHFFPKETILKFIDTISHFKMNYFHWHLTDDQGWRIEIKKYPLLTEIGAWRKEKDGNIYGGYYTQKEVREIVDYAESKGVTIVPEIDIPGHSSAAIVAYPFLCCNAEPIAVPNRWGIFKSIVCLSDSNIDFYNNVFDEITTLFPSKYIHIGGDEVPKIEWMNSDKVDSFKIKHNLKSLSSSQTFFLNAVALNLIEKGRTPIVWGEALKKGLDKRIVVMSWRGRSAGIKAAKRGYYNIHASRFYTYFDYPMSVKDKKSAWWMTYTSPKKVSKFKPIPKRLTDDQKAKTIGISCTLWTEYISNEEQLWYQLIERLRSFSTIRRRL